MCAVDVHFGSFLDIGMLVLVAMIPRDFGDEICGCPLPYVVLYSRYFPDALRQGLGGAFGGRRTTLGAWTDLMSSVAMLVVLDSSAGPEGSGQYKVPADRRKH